MRYLKPHYYEDFRCIADKCPDTCCAGWQIVIDEEKLEEYSRATGTFGDRLYTSVDWREGVFRQNRGRCSFLNEDNLCDLYRELGEGALCRTCAMYPRHVEEFDGLRELSLSLSCPVAARMILTCREQLVLLEEETDEEEELAEEFEDFDLLLFTQLEDARTLIFRVLKERRVPVESRINWVMRFAEELQTCIDEERYFDVDGVIGKYHDVSVTPVNTEKGYREMCAEFQVLEGLERLREEWSEVLSDARQVLYTQGQERYSAICKEFDKNFGGDSKYREAWSLFNENLMLFFIYTYFCGAVYDDEIYSKVALSSFCVRWITELVMARWTAGNQQGDKDCGKSEEQGFDWQLCVDTAYRFAREIEHSDDNLNLLEDCLQNVGRKEI